LIDIGGTWNWNPDGPVPLGEVAELFEQPSEHPLQAATIRHRTDSRTLLFMPPASCDVGGSRVQRISQTAL
jgi:hypothetical protein